MKSKINLKSIIKEEMDRCTRKHEHRRRHNGSYYPWNGLQDDEENSFDEPLLEMEDEDYDVSPPDPFLDEIDQDPTPTEIGPLDGFEGRFNPEKEHPKRNYEGSDSEWDFTREPPFDDGIPWEDDDEFEKWLNANVDKVPIDEPSNDELNDDDKLFGKGDWRNHNDEEDGDDTGIFEEKMPFQRFGYK